MKGTVSAALILILSLSCFYVGYIVSDKEKTELSRLLVESLESEQQNIQDNTRKNLMLLFMLKENKTEEIEDYLKNRVKLGLRENQKIGHDLVDTIANKGNPSEKTISDAIKYQETYCTDNCLGLETYNKVH